MPEAMARGARDRRRPHRALHRAVRAARTARRARREVLAQLRAPRPRPRSALGLGVNAGHDLNLRQPRPTSSRAVPGVLEVSIGHALIADALELGMAETVRAYLRASSTRAADAAMIYGIGTDLCDVRRITADAGARGRPLRREACSGPHEIEVFHARRAKVEEPRRPLPRDALLGQGGVLQGDRHGHAHADDLARLRDRQAAERQARDPPARRARRLVRGARPARARQRQRRDRLRGDLRGRRAGRNAAMNDTSTHRSILDVAGLALDADDRRRLAHPLTGGADPVRRATGATGASSPSWPPR